VASSGKWQAMKAAAGRSPLLATRVPAYIAASAILFTLNGELFQSLGAQGSVSPLFNLWLCHLGGLAFSPLLWQHRDALAGILDGSFWKGTAVLAALVVAYNYAWLLSARHLPIGLTNLFFQSSLVFSYLGSVVCGYEDCSRASLLAVALCMLGVVVACWQDQGGLGGMNPTGAGLGLAAALGCSGYQLAWKGLLGARGAPSWLLYCAAGWAVSFFHLVGTPLLVLAHYSFEPVVLPAWEAVGPVCVTVVVAFLVNVLNVLTIVEGSPVVFCLGNALTLPTAFIADALLKKEAITRPDVLGSACIAAALVVRFSVSLSAEAETFRKRDTAFAL